jgi:nitroreductase
MASEAYNLIRTMRSVRAYRDEPLPEAVAREILDAGRLSGSSKNTQPWVFIAVQDRETLRALTKAGNYTGHLADAALAVVVAVPDPSPSGTPHYDVGRATQNMMLAAWGHGIGSVVAYFHFPQVAAEALGVPEGYNVEWVVSFGYPAEAQDRPPRKGGRKSFDEVVRWKKW